MVGICIYNNNLVFSSKGGGIFDKFKGNVSCTGHFFHYEFIRIISCKVFVISFSGGDDGGLAGGNECDDTVFIDSGNILMGRPIGHVKSVGIVEGGEGVLLTDGGGEVVLAETQASLFLCRALRSGHFEDLESDSAVVQCRETDNGVGDVLVGEREIFGITLSVELNVLVSQLNIIFAVLLCDGGTRHLEILA